MPSLSCKHDLFFFSIVPAIDAIPPLAPVIDQPWHPTFEFQSGGASIALLPEPTTGDIKMEPGLNQDMANFMYSSGGMSVQLPRKALWVAFLFKLLEQDNLE